MALPQVCSQVSLGLAARTAQGRMPFPGDTAYSSELVKYSAKDKGKGTPLYMLHRLIKVDVP